MPAHVLASEAAHNAGYGRVDNSIFWLGSMMWQIESGVQSAGLSLPALFLS